MGDVLDLTLAEVLIREVDLVADLVVNATRDADAAGLRDGLQPGRDIHSVAEDIVVLDHHIAEIEANAKGHAAILGQGLIETGDFVLDFDGAAHSLDSARKLGQDTVPGGADDAAVVTSHAGLDCRAIGGEGLKRRLLIVAHEPAIARHVSAEDGGESAFDGR